MADFILVKLLLISRTGFFFFLIFDMVFIGCRQSEAESHRNDKRSKRSTNLQGYCERPLPVHHGLELAAVFMGSSGVGNNEEIRFRILSINANKQNNVNYTLKEKDQDSPEHLPIIDFIRGTSRSIS